MRKTCLLVVLIALTLLAACNRERNARKNNIEPPAELTEITTQRSVSQLWSRDIGDGEARLGMRMMPAAAASRVYVGDIDGSLRALDASTGSAIWNVDTGAALSSGPGVGEGLVVVGGLNGQVQAFDDRSGGLLWSSQLSSEILTPPVVSRGIVVVRSNDGRIYGLNRDSGQRLWLYDRTMPALSLRGNSPPLVDNGMVYVGYDDGHLVALRLDDGGLAWDQVVSVGEGRTDLDRMVDIDGLLVSTGSEIYAASFQGQVISIASESGRPLWGRPQSSYAGLAMIGDEVIATDIDGNVWALDRRSGSSIWKQDALAHRWLTGPAVQGNTVLVGDLEGYLHWIDVDSGSLVARKRLGKEPIRATPVVSDGIAFVLTTDGELAAYRISGP